MLVFDLQFILETSIKENGYRNIVIFSRDPLSFNEVL
jgi:hypothetical protein